MSFKDTKPNLSREGIEANIEHYEALVASAKDSWEQHVQQLQYWLDQLETVE
jgi:hypothetical protein